MAWIAAGLATCAIACTPRPILERAIRARGGPITGLVRTSTVDVTQGFPGTWHSRTAFLLPDHYAWSVETRDEPTHYLSDGTMVRAFTGTALVSETPVADTPLGSHARFMSVALLDRLRQSDAQVTVLVDADRPAGVTTVLGARFTDRSEHWILGLDDRDLLIHAAGPIDLAPIGRGIVTLELREFRRVDGRWLPHDLRWKLDGQTFAHERVDLACPDPPWLTPAFFRTPVAMPTAAGCVAPGTR